MFANVATFAQAEGALALVRAAEEAGIESLWTVEHVVVPSGYQSTYPYSSSGRMPRLGGQPDPRPLHLAGLRRLRVVQGQARAPASLILPERNPVVTAKEVATLDQLSGGRVLLGVGAGWLEEEFDALGVPFERRGDRLDEYIAALRALWAEEQRHLRGRVRLLPGLHPPPPARGRRRPDPHRRAHRAGRPPGRPAGRRLLPRGQDARAAWRPSSSRCGPRPRRRAATPTPSRCRRPAAGTSTPIKRYADLGVRRCVVPPPTYDPQKIGPALAAFSAEVMAKV